MPRGQVVPITEIGRVQEHGRIRTGVYDPKAAGGRGRPKAIDTFRLTSVDTESLHQLAERYGGVVRPWHNPKANPPHQHELITTSDTLQVVLAGLDNLDQHYELWTGGGLSRRCDGEEVVTFRYARNEDPEEVRGPCICGQKQLLECTLKSRLRVLFPGIPFRGVWRYESGSWNVGVELPSMAELISQFAIHGKLLHCQLRLLKQRRQQGPNVKEFTIVRLELLHSAEALLSGEGTLGMLPGGQLAELGTGEPEPFEPQGRPIHVPDDPDGVVVQDDDDGIVDAEVVESSPARDVPVLETNDREKAKAKAAEVGGRMTKGPGGIWRVWA